MSTLVCPVCNTVYAGWAPRCSTCGVALVQPDEMVDPLTLPEDRQVIYELDGWTLDQRTELGEALAEHYVAHAWDGTDLIVADLDEELVDSLCEQIEGGDAVASDRSGAVAYELETWTRIQREELERRLTAAELAFSWEPGFTLVVEAELEDEVDAIVAELSPDDGESADEDEDADDRPEASAEVLSDLFVAADILARNTLDSDGLSRLTAVIDEVDNCSAPYGMDGPAWDQIADAADDLADAILESADHDAVVERAVTLRNMVRPYV